MLQGTLRNWQKEMNINYHETVLIKETVESLHIEKGKKYIDATLGNAGHTLEILKAKGQVLGIDADPTMISISKNRLSEANIPDENYRLIQGNFTEIDEIAEKIGWEEVDGILFDLGVTNLHLKDQERGFSFANRQADLDMRVDPKAQGVKASDLLNVLREDQLREMFEVTLEAGSAKWITGRTIHSRNQKPIKTVGDFLEICEGLKTGKGGINEATLPFLAVRIAVNSELTNLEEVLPKAYALLKKGGRLVVISFHSKEDVLVKSFFKEKVLEGSKMITFKPVMAGEEELFENKRARSAKLRVLEK